MSIYTYMYKGNVQQKNTLCAASCVTKNISPRFSPIIFYRDVNPVSLRAHPCTAVASMRKTLVFEIVHEESVKVYHLHMYNWNIQQNPLCVESCVTKEFPISPRFSPACFHRDAISLRHSFSFGTDVWLENIRYCSDIYRIPPLHKGTYAAF